jgi:hypothetical protein
MWKSFALMFLMGCAPFEPVETCRIGDLQVHLEQGTCAAYEERFRDALATVERFAPGARWDVSVWVWSDTGQILCHSEIGAYGCYVRGSEEIQVNRSAGSLAHELLHHLEFVRGVPHGDHEGWNERDALSPELFDHGPHRAMLGSWRDTTKRFAYRWQFVNTTP